jgi:hypothetical protein
VFRDDVAVEDVLTLAEEAPPANAQPLLKDVMTKGVRLSRPSLDEVRQRCRQRVAQLPGEVRRLVDGKNYRVRITIDS